MIEQGHSAPPSRIMPMSLDNQFQSAGAASKDFRAPNVYTLSLEDAFLRGLIAGGTKVMFWLSRTHRVFQAVGESALPNICKFVILPFSRPVFQTTQFFFGLVYAAQQRRMGLLRLKHGLMRGDKSAQEIAFDGIKRDLIHLRLDAADDIRSRLDAAKRAADLRYHFPNASLLEDRKVTRAPASEQPNTTQRAA